MIAQTGRGVASPRRTISSRRLKTSYRQPRTDSFGRIGGALPVMARFTVEVQYQGRFGQGGRTGRVVVTHPDGSRTTTSWLALRPTESLAPAGQQLARRYRLRYPGLARTLIGFSMHDGRWVA